MNKVFKDGAFTVTTVSGTETAMLTVRGKDHDFTPSELDKLAAALHQASKLLKKRIRKRKLGAAYARAGKVPPT